jgi:hypothetical protein
MEQTRPRRGRPPKPEHERRRANLTFRIRDDVRYRLAVYAVQAGRSISEEIERRLEQSLNEELILYGVGDPAALRQALFTIALVLSGLERQTGRKAFGPDGDPWLHEQAWKALSIWFAATRPPGEAQPPAKLSRGRYLKRPPPRSLMNTLGHAAMTQQLIDPGGLPSLDDIRGLIEFVREIRKAEIAAQPPPPPGEARKVLDELNKLNEEFVEEVERRLRNSEIGEKR